MFQRLLLATFVFVVMAAGVAAEGPVGGSHNPGDEIWAATTGNPDDESPNALSKAPNIVRPVHERDRDHPTPDERSRPPALSGPDG